MKALGMATVLLLCLASAPGAAADGGLILAEAADYLSLGTHGGGLQLLAVNGAPGEGTPLGSSGSTPSLKIHAGHIEAVQYTEKQMGGGEVAGVGLPRVILPSGNLSQFDPLDPDSMGKPERLLFETRNGSVAMTGYQSDYRLHIFSERGEMAVEAEAGAGRYEASPRVQMAAEGFALVPDSQVQPNPENDFTLVTRAGPLIKHVALGDRFRTIIEGDFVVELQGIDIHVAGDDGAEDMASGRSDDDFGGRLPSSANTPYVVKVQFIRLRLTDAVLELGVHGEGALVETALSEITAVHEGPLTVYGGTAGDAGTALPAGSRLAMGGQADGRDSALLGIRRLPNDAAEPGSTPMSAVAAALPGLALLGIPATLGVVALAYLLRREQLPMTLASVEALLEKGHYGRAARLAGRILRYDPKKEDALISRAVALNRGQRHAKVVRELERHFKSHSPTDGVLHYVLGLSYLDLGEAEKGEAALHEAVRRTPSLRPEVAARLGMPPPVHHLEAHGYA